MKSSTAIGIVLALLALPCSAADGNGGAKSQGPDSDVKVVSMLRRTADSGNAEALRQLGFRYYHGDGVAQDNAKAVALFEKAAAAGDTESASNLGKMYEHGMGVLQDDGRATEWYRRAAEMGEPQSQFTLSVMYYKGQGVPQDRVEAAKWWNIAIARGGKHAEQIRGMVESAVAKLTQEEIAEGKRRSAEWLNVHQDMK
ncbi:MAG: tetratricopeptide repeat protein [Proteobacteria bacterium]|nr:tetratricopeptide repeat protein [Pseudomonadota bacterium]